MAGNHSRNISDVFYFQRFKNTDFSAISLFYIYFSYIELTLIYLMERISAKGSGNSNQKI
jgi:hypothetical protein